MKTLLPKTRNRRKTRIIYLHVELYREKGSPNWALKIRQKGHCTQRLDTGTPHEAAARLFARIMIRDVTNWMRQQPAASSQQPAASSQQPAASSQQPAASSQQPSSQQQGDLF